MADVNTYFNHMGSSEGRNVGTETIYLKMGTSYMQFANLNPTAPNQGSFSVYAGINIVPAEKIPSSNYPFVLVVSAYDNGYRHIGYYNLPKLSTSQSVGTDYGNSFRVNYVLNTTGLGGSYPNLNVVNWANYYSYVYEGATLFIQLYVDAGSQRSSLVRYTSNLFLS